MQEFEDGIQLIASNWLIEETMEAYWPNFTTMNRYYKAVQVLEPIKDSWKLFKVKRILAKTYNYEKGTKILKDAEIFSDLNSDVDDTCLKLRRRTHARLVYSDSDDEESGMENNSRSKIPPLPKPYVSEPFIPPQKPIKNSKASAVTSRKMGCHEPLNNNNSDFEDAEIHCPKQTGKYLNIQEHSEDDAESECSLATNTLATATLPHTNNTASINPKQHNSNPQVTHAHREMPAKKVIQPKNVDPDLESCMRKTNMNEPTISLDNEDFRTYQRFVIRSFTTLKAKINNVIDVVEVMSKKLDGIKCTDNIPDANQEADNPELEVMNLFPICHVKMLQRVEKELTNNAMKQKLMTALLKIGGSDYKNTTTRLMERLFSNYVAEKFSWVGSKGKRIFSTLHLCRVILGKLIHTILN
ncbi:uncharacterized protein LOC124301503 [Neodiprion virginianus]|uniref:uncharacterized protein LOC124301503 n=1 Tax=Neodiprion virginianus TaxID=2961670 RepID=UPI001EE6EF18|nr:uncharacterized protein LOC124301503 [Neodiprion virginianus]